MENQNVPSIKSNNPAPTVEQINADKITQVFHLIVLFDYIGFVFKIRLFK